MDDPVLPVHPEPEMRGPAAQPTKAGSFNATVQDVIDALEPIARLGATETTLALVLHKVADHYGVDLAPTENPR